MMAPPSYVHQTLSMEIAGTIRDYIRRNRGRCQVLSALLAVNLNADDKTYVEPDISVICDRNKISDKGFRVLRTLLWRLYRRPAARWTILRKMRYMRMPGFVNTGL